MNYDNLHAIICRHKDDLEKISGKLVTNASNLSKIVVPTKEELMEIKIQVVDKDCNLMLQPNNG